MVISTLCYLMLFVCKEILCRSLRVMLFTMRGFRAAHFLFDIVDQIKEGCMTMAELSDIVTGLISGAILAILGGVAVKEEVDKAGGDWSIATSNMAKNINNAAKKEKAQREERQMKLAIEKARIIERDRSGKYSEGQKEKAREFLRKYEK